MLVFNENEKDTIEYLVAIAMIIFGMVLCMFAFFSPPVGEIHPTILGVLGQILIFVGAVFHLNIKLKNQNNDFETRVSEMRKEIDSLKQ
jgi:hypothetical protein